MIAHPPGRGDSNHGSTSCSCRTRRSFLDRGRHVADFVRKSVPLWASWNLPSCRGGRSGVGPLQRRKLGFEQGFRDGGDIDRDEGGVGSQAGRMNRLGQQFLAGSCLAEQQHGRAGSRNAPGFVFEGGTFGRDADELAKVYSPRFRQFALGVGQIGPQLW